ncbi:AMP-dependent synthetase/ligase [Methylorubrum extorquens]
MNTPRYELDAALHGVTHEALAGTIPDLLRLQVALRPNGEAYAAYDALVGTFVTHGWSEIAGQVAQRRAALSAEGLEPGARIALWLPNGLEWICFDHAALSLGLVTVPLYARDAVATIAAILEDSAAALLVVQRGVDWLSLRPFAVRCALRRVVVVDPPTSLPEEGPARALAAWLAAARDRPPPGPVAVEPRTLATLVYTSGTTGAPKGVMLSHRNLLSVARAVLARNPGSEADVFLSYLPLAHIFERVVGSLIPLMLGAKVVFARSIETLREDLAAARPTIFLAVPSLLDRLRERVAEAAGRSALRQRLLDATLAVGWERVEARRLGQPVRLRTALAWAALGPLVARPVRAALGGRVRLAVSGGAPLAPGTARFCLSLGLPLVEGYGLTEAASAVTGARVGDAVPGSSGPPLPGMTVRIGAGGEILVRSPGLMLGYWGRPDLDAQVLRDGWLHTGDLGTITEGRLVVGGRMRDRIVLSNGEKVWPEPIEAAIRGDPLFGQVMVIGEGQPRLSALAVVDAAAWARLAEELDLDPAADASLDAATARRAALERIAARLSDVGRAGQVRAVRLLREPWTVERGLVTPSLKVRRAAVSRAFAVQIEAMRDERAAQLVDEPRPVRPSP